MKHIAIFVFLIFILFSLGNCKSKITTPDNTTLAITSPTDGEILFGEVSITVKIYDSSISKVILFIDSSEKSVNQISPYNFTFDFTPYDGKTVKISCNGYDSDGNKVGVSNIVPLVISSSGNNDPNPQ
ncbi:hypothetical protein J7L48_09060 [bacterium]|nr:hypothetical protein [bacterium]